MKILLAENDPVERHRLARLMTKWGFEVVECEEGDQAWQQLNQDDAPRLAVMDWMMPGLSGLEICRRIRQRDERLYSYLVLVTGRQEPEDVEAGLDAGADDYLTKPVQPSELRARLRAGRRILTLQQDLVDAEDQLRQRAERDDLTGLLNRGTILGMLEREVARARREGDGLAIAIGDLDHFKRINDTFGHPAGDRVLGEVSRRMNGLLRRYDSLGRYGGEEFLLVLPRTDDVGVLGVAQRLREIVSGSPMDLGESVEQRVSITFGVTAVGPGKEMLVETLIRRADEALYRGKLAGRDRVVEWTEHLPDEDGE